MSNHIYLITGANRGIGRGLTETLLQRTGVTVIAAVRELNHPTVKSLSTTPTGKDSVIVIVKIDGTSETDAAAAAQELMEKHGISHIDTVIANAGIAKYYGEAVQTPTTEMYDHFTVNAVAPLVLFQAMWPLLKQSAGPKFIPISTGAGSITDMDKFPLPVTAYGSSKAALNFLVRKIHFEHEKDGLIAFPLHPGWVQTDMGNLGARSYGLEAAPVTLNDSIDGLIEKVTSSLIGFCN